MLIAETEKIKFESFTQKWSKRDKAIFAMGQIQSLYNLEALLRASTTEDPEKLELLELLIELLQFKQNGVRQHLRGL